VRSVCADLPRVHRCAMEGSAADTSVEFLNQKRAFQEVNLLEEDLRSGDQKALRVRPHEIRTLKFQVK